MKFDVLRQKCLPNPLVSHDGLMKQDDYDKKMREVAKEQANNSAMQGIPTGKVLYKSFENLVGITIFVRQKPAGVSLRYNRQI